MLLTPRNKSRLRLWLLNSIVLCCTNIYDLVMTEYNQKMDSLSLEYNQKTDSLSFSIVSSILFSPFEFVEVFEKRWNKPF